MKFLDSELVGIKKTIERAVETPICGDDVVARKRIGAESTIVLKDRFYCVYTLEEVQYMPQFKYKHLSVACMDDIDGATREEFDEIALAFGFDPENRNRQLISNIPVPEHPRHKRLSIVEYPIELYTKKNVKNIHVNLVKDLEKL